MTTGKTLIELSSDSLMGGTYDVAAAADVLKSTLIQNLLEQRVQVQRTLAEFSATLLPSHPRLKQLNSELSGLRHQIRKEARKVEATLPIIAAAFDALFASVGVDLSAKLDELHNALSSQSLTARTQVSGQQRRTRIME